MKEQQVLLGTEAIKLTLARTSKFIPPPWYKGGGGGRWIEPLPGVLDILQYFETIIQVQDAA